LRLFATLITSPLFQESSNPQGVALDAGVMQRFERVVALPDPKDIEFPQPHQRFHPTLFEVQKPQSS
jgi:hypothetical protein